MKKICLAFCLLIIGMGATHAQTPQRKCGSMEALDKMIRDNPAIAVSRDAIEKQTQKFIAERGLSASRSSITIPVVVHVVYSTAVQNISDAQILSQIAVLNADYSRTNSNWSRTPAPFQSLSGSPGIQFCMAQRDPSGNATTGIVRKSTTVTSFTVTDAVKYSNMGGDDAWPSSSYLNLWVCDLGSGLLGYSQFPGGAAATDGVVINYTAMGDMGTAAPPFDQGRTATHEIGHWLNLYHIWGDDNGACTGTDHVDDTPNQAGQNFGSPSYPHISCTNGPNGDMYMNFMDYTDDSSMTMFSAGQSARIQSLFATGGARASLISSAGCIPPGGNSTACATPAPLTTGIVASPTDTIKWSSISAATSYILEYKPASSSVWATTATSDPSAYLTGLAPGTTYTYHVEAVCHTGSSVYSTINSFTTAPGISSCSDVYEPNESIASARQIEANANINAMIGSASDKDYFKFSNTEAEPNIKVSLSNLPADYDLKLYDTEGRMLFSSTNNGNTSESIIYNSAPAGTYYAYVYGDNGASQPADCYTLTTSIAATAWPETTTAITEVKNEVQYSIYSNPNNGKFHLMIASSSLLPKVSVSITDVVGKVVQTQEYENIEGLYSFEINLGNVAAGIYDVTISDGQHREAKQVIVQH